LKASYFEIIATIQSEFSHWFSEFDMSHKIFTCSFTSIELLSRQGGVTLLYSLVNSTTKNISEDLLDAELLL